MSCKIRVQLRPTMTLSLGQLFFMVIAAQNSVAQTAKDSTWRSHAEPRLKSIYDRSEFRAKSFRPNWLSDSSGFLVDEVDPSTNKQTTWFYDSKSGERRSASEDDRVTGSNNQSRSVNDEIKIEARSSKLVAVNQKNKTELTLASTPADRKVEFRNPILSPDGSKVLFVEADFSGVRQRWVLVPGDPSYPEVQQNRFARVGGQIEKLRIGVVNIDGEQLTWLPVDCPEEGMYLG
ncbi:MAG: hypothetical protein ABL921_10715, partial [Pirellula sp.]